eukprot:CAMPEP_0204631206 /NCGR_PEP_ID=MMETSP0717-20131115/22237_1 /ASSEMBLY_ACC=CAM_ASM_000666 /TAXON_ID=230516 /ORGANISM="Chaetoceros curvisetus" /LENGTH=662 /DNA_ID=CAMNT_0051648707 /DNA_START=106 /DNA_END=2094 /DNA_ORIENTATION=+
MAPKIRIFLAVVLLILDLPSQRITVVHADAIGGNGNPKHQPTTPTLKNTKGADGNTNTYASSTTTTAAASAASNKKSSSLVEVYEHEYYDRQKLEWMGGDGISNANVNTTSSSSNSDSNGHSSSKTQRWTSSPLPSYRNQNTKYLPPPSQLPPPRGYEYISDWKIDVTGKSKDELGWEYFVDQKEGMGRRRRRWLRTVSVLETSSSTVTVEAKKSSSSTSSTTSSNSSSIIPKIPSTTSKIAQRRTTSSPSSLKRSTAHTSVGARSSRMPQKITPKIIKELQDSFNFKGYGLNLYKSLLYKNACGIGWRLPLTPNFEFMESRPYLPLITSSVILYYPLRFSVLFNASLPVELFQWCVYAILDWCLWSMLMLQCMSKTIVVDFMGRLIVWNSLKALGKILAFGEVQSEDHDDSDSEEDVVHVQDKSSTASAAKKKKRHTVGSLSSASLASKSSTTPIDNENRDGLVILERVYPPIPIKRAITYHQGISDRLGLSVSAQVSEREGIQFRWSWWHVYMPTIDFLGSTVDNFVATLTKKKPKIRGDVVSEWLRQKFASLGISWGGFAPEPPYYSCSAIFSLSGFYYSGEVLRKLCSGMILKGTLLNTLADPSFKSNPKKGSTINADRSKAKLDRRLRREGLNELDIADVSSVESEMELINVKVGAR